MLSKQVHSSGNPVSLWAHVPSPLGEWMTRPSNGFTLVELMIVIAVVALLAMIAVPSAVRARQIAEDAKTTKELRSIFEAVVMFQVNNGFRLRSNWVELREYITVDESKYEINPT